LNALDDGDEDNDHREHDFRHEALIAEADAEIATVSGTIAALVPTELPATKRVNGMIATIRMMNGVERTRLTTEPSTRLKIGNGRIWPGLVTTSSTPSGRPSAVEITAATETM
jgi:hypothetical protein